MISNFRSIIPHKLFRGSAPNPQDVIQLHNILGIKKIVSLDQETGDKIDRICKLLSIKHVKLYIDFSLKSLLNFLSQDFKHIFLDNGPTFVHCHWGRDRTGLATALVECKYLHKKPKQALQEAQSLGLGLDLDPKITRLYEKLILNCKPVNKSDTNNASNNIVSNEREYQGDNRDSFLDEAHQGSFAPYLDHTKQNPMDAVYTYTNDQSPTRENYPDTSLFDYNADKGSVIPNVGEYDNDAGMRGIGPSESYNGFFSEISH